MALSDLTRDAVMRAISEYDEMGRDDFLTAYGMTPTPTRLITYGGRTYDSRAVAGVAHQYTTGSLLWSNQFTEGDTNVVRTLRSLGFTVLGSRNPDWSWDETVLTCALVADSAWRPLEDTDRRVVDLSALLRRLPIHPLGVRTETFRNPNGVARKTSDLATHHPDYRGRPTNGSSTDRAVIRAFLEQPEEMQRIAAEIRAGARRGDFDDAGGVDAVEVEDAHALEGHLLVRRHITRERNQALRRRKIESVRKAGKSLSCEACGFDFQQTYGALGDGYIECHHRVPLHASGQVRTRLLDLALICANCHRMIHRSSPWLSVERLQEIVNKDAYYLIDQG